MKNNWEKQRTKEELDEELKAGLEEIIEKTNWKKEIIK